MTTRTDTPTVVLIAGHWLGAWAWDEVVDQLGSDHAHVIAMTLPGLDDDDPVRSTRTLDDQVDAIVATLTRLDPRNSPAVVVAHSGANAPVGLVLDRHRELVRRVVWVDSGPPAAGTAFAPDLPGDIDELPLPPFDVLAQQASLDGLDAETLDRFRRRSVPEPGPVLRQNVDLSDDARHTVPTTLICCSIPSAQILGLARDGHPMFEAITHLTDLEVIDLPTGHWPMWSRAADLAEAIRSAASPTG